ncbi:MAG: YihY/virulence factor BrkB family protein [Chloroflexi bacterium]|nr:YihY/virulence factor BrkB family protein [Chloroflexota bacterium]
MSMAGKGLTLLRLALVDFSRNNCPYMAAAIAYWALFSLFPLALATMSIIAYLNPSPDEHLWVLQGIIKVIPVSREYVVAVIQDLVASRGTLGLLAAAGLLFTGTAVFSAVRKGINHAWHMGKPPYFLLERATDLVMLLGVGVLALIMVAFTTNLLGLSSVARTPEWIGGGLAGKAVLELGALLATFGVFSLLYRFVPNTKVAWRDVWLGAAMGAAFFQAVRLGFTWFVLSFGRLNLVYGVLGSLMAVLIWSYLASMALMWGAQVCFTYSRLYGSREALGVPQDLLDAPEAAPSRETKGLAGPLLTVVGWLLPPRKRQP